MRNYDIITSLEKNGISIKDKEDIYLPSIYEKICEFCAILDYYVALYEFRNLNETPSGTSLPWSYELYRIKLCAAIRDLANTCGCFPEKSFFEYMEQDRLDLMKNIFSTCVLNFPDYYADSYDLLFYLSVKIDNKDFKKLLNRLINCLYRASTVYSAINMSNDKSAELFKNKNGIVYILSLYMRSPLLSFFEFDLFPFLKREMDDGRLWYNDYDSFVKNIVYQLLIFYRNRQVIKHSVNEYAFTQALDSLVANRIDLNKQINEHFLHLISNSSISDEDKEVVLRDYFVNTHNNSHKSRTLEEGNAMLSIDTRTCFTVIDGLIKGDASLEDKNIDSFLNIILSFEDARDTFFYTMYYLECFNCAIINKIEFNTRFISRCKKILLGIISNKNFKIDYSIEKEILSLVDLGAFTIDEMSLALARRNNDSLEDSLIVQDLLNKLRLRADSTLYRDIPEDVFTYKI